MTEKKLPSIKDLIEMNYPHGIKDIDKLKEINNGILERSINSKSFSSTLRSIVNLGLLEVQNRLQKDLNVEISSLKVSNEKWNKRSTRLSYTVISLAVITVAFGIFTAIITKNDRDSDIKWKNEQLFELKKQSDFQKSIDKNLKLIPFRDSI